MRNIRIWTKYESLRREKCRSLSILNLKYEKTNLETKAIKPNIKFEYFRMVFVNWNDHFVPRHHSTQSHMTY